MSKLEIKSPALLKITNTSERVLTFAPYRENFVSNIAAGVTLEFSVDTAGQALYYLMQGTEDLVVEQIEEFDSVVEDDLTLDVIELPALITITNTSDKVKSFVPYKENFTYDVQPGDAVEFEAKTIGQVLYYDSQETEGLEVKHSQVVSA